MTLRRNQDPDLGMESADPTGSARPEASGRLPRELRVFWLCSFAGLLLTIVVGWLKYHAGQSRYNWDPLSDPLFGDLDEYNGTYTLLHQASFFFNVEGRPWPYPMFGAVAYPPFAAAVMAPFYRSPIPAQTFLIIYFCGAVVMAGAFFGKLWRMPVANQLLAVSTFMVMFPPISYYHALVHMYAPLVVLAHIAIRADRAGIKLRGLSGTMLLFIPLFSAFTLLTYPTRLIYCGLVQGVVLIVIFFCALEFPFAVPVYSADPA